MSLATRTYARRLAAFGFLTALATYACVAGGPELVHFVAGREMLVENVGAVAFLATSLIFLGLAISERKRASAWRKVQLFGLAAFFFLAFGEEASWGQHWLGFKTPEELRALNAQEETNLHNLWVLDSYATGDGKSGTFEKKQGLAAVLLNSNRLFDLIMIGFFWLLPAAAAFPTPLRGWLARLGTPVPAWPFAWLLLANFAASGLAELALVDGMARHLAVSEIREFVYALLGFLAALELRRRPAPAG